VEYQCTGFQGFFEFFLTECYGLVVVVRTVNFELYAVAHEPPAAGRVTSNGWSDDMPTMLTQGWAGFERNRGIEG
jgi:hypothetical protein